MSPLINDAYRDFNFFQNGMIYFCFLLNRAAIFNLSYFMAHKN